MKKYLFAAWVLFKEILFNIFVSLVTLIIFFTLLSVVGRYLR